MARSSSRVGPERAHQARRPNDARSPEAGDQFRARWRGQAASPGVHARCETRTTLMRSAYTVASVPVRLLEIDDRVAERLRDGGLAEPSRFARALRAGPSTSVQPTGQSRHTA